MKKRLSSSDDRCSAITDLNNWDLCTMGRWVCNVSILQVTAIMTSPAMLMLSWLSAVGGMESSPWNPTLFPGCAICRCSWGLKTINCSDMSGDGGQMPHVESLPHQDVRALYEATFPPWSSIIFGLFFSATVISATVACRK